MLDVGSRCWLNTVDMIRYKRDQLPALLNLLPVGEFQYFLRIVGPLVIYMLVCLTLE